MKVDFNNLRKKLCFAYDSLAKKLNAALEENRENIVNIDILDIQDDMDELKSLIVTVASCSDGSDDVQDVYSKEYPDDKLLVQFNPEEE